MAFMTVAIVQHNLMSIALHGFMSVAIVQHNY